MDFLPVIIHSLSLAIKKSIIMPPAPSGRPGFLAEKNGAAIAQQHKKSMASLHRGSNRLLPLVQVIDFHFYQESCFDHSGNKVSTTSL